MAWLIVAYLVLDNVQLSINAQWAVVAWLGLLMAVDIARKWLQYRLSKPPLSIPPRRDSKT